MASVQRLRRLVALVLDRGLQWHWSRGLGDFSGTGLEAGSRGTLKISRGIANPQQSQKPGGGWVLMTRPVFHALCRAGLSGRRVSSARSRPSRTRSAQPPRPGPLPRGRPHPHPAALGRAVRGARWAMPVAARGRPTEGFRRSSKTNPTQIATRRGNTCAAIASRVCLWPC